MTRRITVMIEGREYHVEVGDLAERPVRASVNGNTYHVYIRNQDGPAVERVQPAGNVKPAPSPVTVRRAAPAPVDSAVIRAPLPGDIVEVRVRAGDAVRAGDVVCVLEAMKMKNLIHSAQEGVVASIEVQPGQTVDYGAALVTLGPR